MTDISTLDRQALGQRLSDYCDRYCIPVDYFFEIINDQKVLPMLRGKGMEYNAFLLLQQQLNSSEWSTQKLNLSAQPGSPDQDISITHRRTGTTLIVESKSAVRGSMSAGAGRQIHKTPHFKVKSHRSRSSIKLADTSNDRYKADAFDVLITNPSNAVFAGNTIGENLELIADPGLIEILYKHYNVSTSAELIKATNNDWRFVLPKDIADANGFIPRTPTVFLQDDPHWLPINQMEKKIAEVVIAKRKADRSKPARS